MFKSGYTLMLFRILEDDVVDFLTYITLEYYSGDKRKEIFSPRLAELLIRIGSQVDIFFRYWNLVQDLNPSTDIKNLNISHYKKIEQKINLSHEKIKILATSETIIPFKDWTEDGKPEWWTAYNHVKHNGFYYKEEGNLSNVIESLSALFLLNCIHEETQTKLIEYGYRKLEKTGSDLLYYSSFISQLFTAL